MRRLVFLLIALGFCNIKAYGQVAATWTDSSGNWSNGANWSTSSAPNDGGGAFYNAVINGTGSDTITFDASGTVVNGLTIGAGEIFQDNGLAPTLTVGDPSSPAAGTLTNNGTINWGNGATLTLANYGANDGSMNVTGATLTFAGGGANNGTINVTGGSTLALDGVFENYGTLNINHGSLTGSYDTIGGSNGSTGYNPATGSLIINNGSTASLAVLNSFTNTIEEGPTIVENGSTLTVGFLYNYQTGLEDLSGSVVTIGGIDNANGGLLIDNSTMNLAYYGYSCCGTGGAVVVQSGGILNVAGNYDSNGEGDVYTSVTVNSVLNIGGVLTVSQFSNFTVGNSVLNVGGDVDVYGNLTIDQSTATVQGNVNNGLVGGFVPEPGQLTVENGATLSVLGNFSNSGGSGMTLGGGDLLPEI